MNVKLDIPYPEIRVEEKNPYYADLLSQDYAGNISETTAILLYSYQNFDKFSENKEFSKLIAEIATVEMKHLAILGKTIKLLGKSPSYKTCQATGSNCVMWTASNVDYETNLKEMLKIDIKNEEAAIKMYENHKNMIDDKYIKEIISRIILDEKNHVKIFKYLYEKLR